jgi:hypothetical protein
MMPSDSVIVSVYRMPDFYRSLLFVVLGAAGLIAAVLLGLTAASATSAPAWFVVAWSLIVVYAGYFYIWKTAFELRLEGDLFVWRTPLRSGAEPAAGVRRLRPCLTSPNVERFELGNGKRIVVMIRKGFQELVDDFHEVAPTVPIDVSPLVAQMFQRWPGMRSSCESWRSHDPPNEQ